MENLWGWLKARVIKDNPRTLDALEQSLRENWEEVTPEFIQNFIDSIYDRIDICI